MSVVEDEFGGVRSRVELFEKLAASPAKRMPSSVVLASPTGMVKEVVHMLTTPTKVTEPRCENRDPQALLASSGKVKDSVQKFQEQADGATKRRKVEAHEASDNCSSKSPPIAKELEARKSMGTQADHEAPILKPSLEATASSSADHEAPILKPSLEATASSSAEHFPEGLEQYSLSSMWASSDDAKQSEGAKPQNDAKEDVQAETKPAVAPKDESLGVPAGLDQYSLTPVMAAQSDEEQGHRRSIGVPAGLESYSLNMSWKQDEDCDAKSRDKDETSEKSDGKMGSAGGNAVPGHLHVEGKEVHSDDSFEIDGLVQEASDDLEATAANGEKECELEHKTSGGEKDADAVLPDESKSGQDAHVAGADEDEEEDLVLVQTTSDCVRDVDNEESIAKEFERHDRENALRAAREKDAADGFQDALEADGFDMLRRANGGVRHAAAGHTPITRSLAPSTRSGKKRKASDLEVDGL